MAVMGFNHSKSKIMLPDAVRLNFYVHLQIFSSYINLYWFNWFRRYLFEQYIGTKIKISTS